MTRSRPVGPTVTAVICALLALAAQADSPKRIEVPAGDLVAALEALSKQAQVNLVYQALEMQGLKTQGVSGTLTPREAVMKLLQGTALRLSTDESTGAMLISGPARGEAASGQRDIDGNSIEQQIRLARGVQPGAANGAQSAGADDSLTSADDPAAGGHGKDPLEEIVITSTRVERAGFTAPTPTTILSAEELRVGG